MTERNRIYGLIPARSGSEGLPGKNLRPLCGKPLITYIIQAALTANELDAVFVSTDGDDIARVAQDSGAQVILHPAHLSAPDASTFGVVKNFVKQLQNQDEHPDIVVTMRPTSPLCLSEDIDKALAMLSDHTNVDSVIGVTKSDIHPHRVLAINGAGELHHFDKASVEIDFPLRRQTLEDVYVRTGAIYATRVEVIKRGSLWGTHCIPYIMPKERSVNINDWIDFLFAESLLKIRNQATI
jgi:CMP-N,N'-diacetyllegionaminic acid synthase